MYRDPLTEYDNEWYSVVFNGIPLALVCKGMQALLLFACAIVNIEDLLLCCTSNFECNTRMVLLAFIKFGNKFKKYKPY